jgi:hypothetical protein
LDISTILQLTWLHELKSETQEISDCTMKKQIKATIEVQGAEISILGAPEGDFISLTNTFRSNLFDPHLSVSICG